MIAGVSDIMATLHFGTGWKSFQLFLLLSEKVMAQTSNWHFIAFSFDSSNDKGLFVVDKRIGFDKKTSDGKIISRKGIYFDVESPEWITGIFLFTNYNATVSCSNLIFLESTRKTLRIGGSKLETNSNFDGKLSCFQYFNMALTPSQIHHSMNCDLASAYKTSSCPEHFHDIDGLCYYFPSIQLSFSEAELFCMSPFDEV